MLAYNLNCWLMLFNREEQATVETLGHTTLLVRSGDQATCAGYSVHNSGYNQSRTAAEAVYRILWFVPSTSG